MKKILTFVFAAITLLFTPELRAQQTGNPDQSLTRIAALLPGTWEWTESRFASRGVTPTLKTPASQNTKVSISFREGNQASVYINKKLAGMYQYTLTQPTDYVLISFKANEGQQLPEYLQEGPITITDNEILIAGGYNDAGQNVKFRKAGTTPTPVTKPAAPVKKPAPKKPATPKKKTSPTKTAK